MKLRQQIKILKNFMKFMVVKDGDYYYCIRDIHDKKHYRIKYSRKQFYDARRGFRQEVMDYIRKCQNEYYSQVKIEFKSDHPKPSGCWRCLFIFYVRCIAGLWKSAMFCMCAYKYIK